MLYGVYVAAFVFSIATSVLCIIRSSRECQTGADAVLVLAVKIFGNILIMLYFCGVVFKNIVMFKIFEHC